MNQIVKFPETAESALKHEDALAYYVPSSRVEASARKDIEEKPANIAVLDEMYGYYTA
ncbi:hypothetical protein [Thioclava sp. GXIMD4216]|uniref:Uncharacterized protein n=1 Tax=Thioclava litoralis TaxID=3076557 RepID=A0ABZ1DVE8_9RHOB|nr:hypothetical protein RPE78_08310 [Thioclava sp. FTW29]